MNSSNRLALLRQRAEQALASQESSTLNAPPEVHQHFQKIFEELRIYEAELEIQNAELTEALRINEHLRDQFASLFHRNPAATVIIDEQGIITDANPAGINLFRFGSINHLRYHSIFRLLEPESGFALKQAIRNFLRNALEDRMLQQLRTATTSNLPEDQQILDCTLSRLPQSYGEGQNVLLLFDNKTESYGRETDLHLYKSLLDHARAHMAVFGVDGTCLFANRSMLDFYGRKAEEMIGRKREDWMSADDAEQQNDLDQLVVHSSSAVVREYLHHNARAQKQLMLGYRFPVFRGYNELVGIGLINTELNEANSADHQPNAPDDQPTR